MFETVAAEILAAVQERQARDKTDQPNSECWRSIRGRCKEVIILLEVCGREALAERVEREYDRLSQAWHEADGSVAAEHRLAVAADELSTSLSILERFRNHLGQARKNSETTGLAGSATADPGTSGQTRRHQGRGSETTRKLRAHLDKKQIRYKQLVRRILEGDEAAILEFQDEFGPTALATRWGLEEGEPPNGSAVNRWSTAIKGTRIYKEQIQPLLARPPRAPRFWELLVDDKSWDPFLT